MHDSASVQLIYCCTGPYAVFSFSSMISSYSGTGCCFCCPCCFWVFLWELNTPSLNFCTTAPTSAPVMNVVTQETTAVMAILVEHKVEILHSSVLVPEERKSASVFQGDIVLKFKIFWCKFIAYRIQHQFQSNMVNASHVHGTHF